MSALHELHQSLLDLGICQEGSLVPTGFRTRDKAEVSALRCTDSGIIVLDQIDHINPAYYPDKQHTDLAKLGSRESVVKSLSEDTTRRVEQFRNNISGKHWLDVGTGAGAILDALSEPATTISAVEPQGEFQAILRQGGYQVYGNVRDVPQQSVDVATLFHVFEHLPTPLADLLALRGAIRPGGQVVIEVPHARDALLTRYESDEFGRFTMWAEHLLLHTRESLTTFLHAAGFVDVQVTGFQRYPLANTLRWLSDGKPGGHEAWSDLRDDDLDAAYGAKLAGLDMTDTLIATALVPALES